MPWKASTVMSQRQEFVELAVRERANVRALCREFGITARTAYKWLRRYREQGLSGLYERSRRPNHSPQQSPPVVEGAVLQVRQAHPSWGARKIRWVLQQAGEPDCPAASTITAILRRHDQLDPQERLQHHPLQRFAMEAPNQLWQMDFKGHFEMADGWLCHPLTVLDDASRFLVGLRACSAERARHVKSQLQAIFEVYGLPERMLMDNGSVWQGYHTRLTFWLVRLGIQVVHGRPYHPQTQGKDERLHRTLQSELLHTRSFFDLADCQTHFDAWRTLYNEQRPHEALQMQVPASHYRPSARPYTGQFPAVEYEPHDLLRKTDVHGRLVLEGRRFHVGKAFGLCVVAVRPTPQEGIFQVFYFRQRIAHIDLRQAQP